MTQHPPASASQPPPLPPGRGSQDESSGAPPAPTNSRVDEFWQRAQTLMALEHGLTPACQVKLATMAQELQLSDDEYQQALGKLRGRAEPEAPPSMTEQRASSFREYVDRKLTKLATPMLDAPREDRWIATAAEKYGLDGVTARKVVEKVAGERGVRRVTRDEALVIVEQMVAEKVDEGVWLDHATAQRLIVAGQVWGLSAPEVDEVIRRLTAANRERLAAERWRSRAYVVGAVAVAVCVAGFGVWLLFGRGWSGDAQSREVATKAEPGSELGASDSGAHEASAGDSPDSATSTKRVGPPAWWDGRLAVATAQARTWFRSFRGLYDTLASARSDERATGYEKLVAWSGVATDEEAERSPSAIAREILVLAYAGDPDDAAAQRLAASLAAPIAQLTRRSSAEVAAAPRGIWAVETAAQAATWPELSDERRAGLRRTMTELLEVDVPAKATVPEVRRMWLGAFARIVLRRAIDMAASDPSKALELHDAVRDSAGQLPAEELRRLQATLLAVGLPAAGEQWNDWRHVVQDALATRDPLLLVPLVELYERGGSSPWRDSLGELLRSRAGSTSETKDPAELARIVREALGLSAASSKALPLDVWAQLKAPVDAAVARSREEGDEEELLLRAVDLAYWGTLAAAAAHGDGGRHVWDQAFRDGAPKRPEESPRRRERVGVFGPVDDAPGRPAVPPQLANARRAQVQRLAGALEHFDRLEPIQRLNNLRGLAMLAAETRDVTSAQGQNIARYLLSHRPDPEGREMREAGRHVVGWPQVQLGLADHVVASKLEPAALAELIGAALGRTVSAEEAERGREALRRELLSRVLDGMSGAAIASDRQAALVSRAEEATSQITAQYARRAALWAFDPMTVSEPSPGTLVAALTRHVATRASLPGKSPAGGADDLVAQAAIADFQSVTDLHRLVAWERLWVRLVAREMARLHPDQAADANLLVARELDGERATGSLLAQYVRLEALQLRIWMLAARGTGGRS